MITPPAFPYGSASAGLACALPGLAPAACAQIVPKTRACWSAFRLADQLDFVARLLVEQMKGYASSLIVDNRPGAGGRIALEALKAAMPRRSLLASHLATRSLSSHTSTRGSAYDPCRISSRYRPSARPFLLAVGPWYHANVTTLAQFVDWCRANPKLATYGTPGAGTRPHFLGATLARAAGFEFVHLPIRVVPPRSRTSWRPNTSNVISVISNALPARAGWGLRALATTAHGEARCSPKCQRLGKPDIPGWRPSNGSALSPGEDACRHGQRPECVVQRALQTDALQIRIGEAVVRRGGLSRMTCRTHQSRYPALGGVVKASGFKPIE